MRRFNSRRRAVAGSPALPLANPDLFGRLLPEVDAACEDWIRSGIRVPTKDAVSQMTNRIYENVVNKYPDMENFARTYDRYMPYVQGQSINMFGVEVQTGGAFLGLLTFLLLAGFFFRRGRFVRR